jgi:sulfate adenylyltransferase large subunit
MVTGASTADLAIVLVDARRGVLEQTRRHMSIVAMLGVHHVAVAVNKMDLVEWSEQRFREIETELLGLAEQVGIVDLRVFPVSALEGDYVVEASDAAPWYEGTTLLDYLETVELAGDRNLADRRFPVQWVIRPMATEHHDYRGYAGQVASGTWRVGDDVVVLPSGRRSRVAHVESADGELDEAVPPMSVVIRLEDDLDVSRGDMLADPERAPVPTRELVARISWMSERPLERRARLAVKHTTRWVRAVVDELRLKIDMETMTDIPAPDRLELNDLAEVTLRLSEPLAVDPYSENRTTGAFVLVDEATNETVGAGMVVSAT